MGGWVKAYEDNEKIIWECAMCNNPKHTIVEKKKIDTKKIDLDELFANCILCDREFMIGNDGNELGFCIDCQKKPDFPFDLDRYYADLDNGKTIFKGFETMSRGILESYRKTI